MFHDRRDLPRRVLSTCAGLALACAPVALASAQQPDNSRSNQGQHTTAESQSSHTSDRELTAKVRRTLIHDKNLSTYGHNVKIITRDGAVTLKGPVHSTEEKQAIVADAAGVVGQDKITDQLSIKP